MAEISHFENRHNVIFFCRRWSDLDNMSETGAEWHVDGGDVVEIETRCRIPIWRTFGRIQWPVIPEPRITLKGAVTWRHQCHHRDTLQDVIIPSAILKIVFRHFIFFCFQCSLCFDERRLSYRLRYTCLLGNDKAGLNVKHDTCSSQSGLMMSRCLSLTHWQTW